MGIFAFLFVVLALLISCDQKSGNSTPVIDCDSTSLVTSTYEDDVGDADFSFIDLGSLSIKQNDTFVCVEINLLDFPDYLTYNNVNVTDNHREYSWTASFDIDNDGENSNNLELSISYYKFAGSEQSQGDVLDFAQVNAWYVDDTGLTSNSIANLKSTRAGNKLTIYGSRSESSYLDYITVNTPVKFSSSFNASNVTYRDIYPNDGSYVAK